MVRGMRGRGEEVKYSEKSLSAKRFERIFGDIVDLLIKSTTKPPAIPLR
jgi:hypothetical protein